MKENIKDVLKQIFLQKYKSGTTCLNYKPRTMCLIYHQFFPRHTFTTYIIPIVHLMHTITRLSTSNTFTSVGLSSIAFPHIQSNMLLSRIYFIRYKFKDAAFIGWNPNINEIKIFNNKHDLWYNFFLVTIRRFTIDEKFGNSVYIII